MSERARRAWIATASFAEVVRQVLPSAVLVRTPSGLGSGVVLDSKGNIVTNAHVAGGSGGDPVRRRDPLVRPNADAGH